jgi:1-acyl-sn-glycerol-3-phosphate acyltransferase
MEPHELILKRRGPWLIRVFTRHVKKRYLARSFHGVRLSKTGRLPELPDGPLIVVVNHPSWWDPLVGMVLAELLPMHMHFVPIEASALKGYGFFERLGFFGVQPGSVEGARSFLRLASGLLSRPRTALWITAQGRFADPRERPPGLMSGVGHLIRRLEGGAILPLALEYPFWDDRFPEALARFGAPLPIGKGEDRDVETWMSLIEHSLMQSQDLLAEEARQRNVELFDTLVEGSAGVGGVYGMWRRIKGLFRRPPASAKEAPAQATVK